jgi:hypothetical protein
MAAEPIRDTRRPYKAFLVRLWLTSEAGGSTWRASIEEAASGRKVTFACLSALFHFLLEETQVEADKGSVRKAINH